MADNTRLEIAKKQIEFARQYTLELITGVEDDQWYQFPGNATTHLAWQLGHVAVAEYGLGLFRIRGRQPEDAELLPGVFRKRFGKGTTPEAGSDGQPAPSEIRSVLQQVHEAVLAELERHTEEDLEVPVEEPHALFATKLGALFFCSLHEMMHAGQIGVLRRMLGCDPLR